MAEIGEPSLRGEKVTKAADIPEEAMLAAIRRDAAERGASSACTWTIAEREGWPVKVALAKLRRMERRRLVDGCACGCRGDWTTVEAVRTPA